MMLVVRLIVIILTLPAIILLWLPASSPVPVSVTPE